MMLNENFVTWMTIINYCKKIDSIYLKKNIKPLSAE